MTSPSTETAVLQHLVGGVWVDGDGPEADSTNPAQPDSRVATYRTATEGMLEKAMSAADHAAGAWDRLGILARGHVLRRAAEILTRRADEVTALMTQEQGKTLADSRGEVGPPSRPSTTTPAPLAAPTVPPTPPATPTRWSAPSGVPSEPSRSSLPGTFLSRSPPGRSRPHCCGATRSCGSRRVTPRPSPSCSPRSSSRPGSRTVF